MILKKPWTNHRILVPNMIHLNMVSHHQTLWYRIPSGLALIIMTVQQLRKVMTNSTKSNSLRGVVSGILAIQTSEE